MKIAYITSSLVGGGGPLPIPAVTRVLRDAGAQVEIFALSRDDGRALPAMLSAGLNVHIREGDTSDRIRAFTWLRQQLKDYQPELLWTSVSRASLIGLLLGHHYHIPVVCWQHNAYLKSGTTLLFYLLRKRPLLWIGDSEMVSLLTAKRFNVPPDRMATWPLFAADPDAPQSVPWQPGQTLQLGSLGRLHPQKDYGLLIKALQLLRHRGFVAPVPFRISIAGDGPLHDTLVQAAARAGCADINFVGFASEPQDFLAGLHVYLQPSRLEGFCIAVHEAMQAGLPIIASTVGQIPYSVEQGRSGWLIPPRNVNALADALADAIGNPHQLATMGAAARARVLPIYSADAFRNAGENLLQRITAKIAATPLKLIDRSSSDIG